MRRKVRDSSTRMAQAQKKQQMVIIAGSAFRPDSQELTQCRGAFEPGQIQVRQASWSVMTLHPQPLPPLRSSRSRTSGNRNSSRRRSSVHEDRANSTRRHMQLRQTSCAPVVHALIDD